MVATTTKVKASGRAMSARRGTRARISVSGSERVAPEKAPAKMPIRVMPICTVERKLVGSSARRMARAAPRLPARAITSSRARRAETMASSDMAKKPLTTTSTSTIRIETSIHPPRRTPAPQ